MTARVVVAGVGSELRRDDGVGPEVVRRASEAGLPDSIDFFPVVDPVDLIGVWDHSDVAVIVDATRSGGRPGTVQVLELAAGAHSLPQADLKLSEGTASTHALGLSAVLRLSLALGCAPHRVMLVGVEGAEFGPGPGLSTSVEAAVPRAVARVLELVSEGQPCA